MYGLYLENITLPIMAYYGLFLVLKIVKKQMTLILLNFASSSVYTHGQDPSMRPLEFILNEFYLCLLVSTFNFYWIIVL